MSKNIRSTVAYVLDPDLAIPDVMGIVLATKYGIKKLGTPQKIKNKASIKARGKASSARQTALNLIVDEVAPFIDLLRYPDFATHDQAEWDKLVVVQPELSISEYTRLNRMGQQLYVAADSAMYDRFQAGSDYAGLPVPVSGQYTPLSETLINSETVKVRGLTSTTPKGTRHMLVRLSDGSLLEFYTMSTSIADAAVKSAISTILSQEPHMTKKHVIAKALTDELGRPAYSLDKLISVLNYNEGLSTTPRTEEVTEVVSEYEVIKFTQNPNSVLEIIAPYPIEIFFKPDGDTMVKTNAYYTALLTKYRDLATANGGEYLIAWNAINQMQRVFDTRECAGTRFDRLNPIVAEAILDDYLAGTDRDVGMRKLIEDFGAIDFPLNAASNKGALGSFFGLKLKASSITESIKSAKQAISSAAKDAAAGQKTSDTALTDAVKSERVKSAMTSAVYAIPAFFNPGTISENEKWAVDYLLSYPSGNKSGGFLSGVKFNAAKNAVRSNPDAIRYAKAKGINVDEVLN